MRYDIFNLIVVIISTIVLMYFCRSVFCWYWKINRVVSLLEELNVNLRFIAKMSLVNNAAVELKQSLESRLEKKNNDGGN